MNILLSATFWFLVSLLFALLEIEIEGKYGWSEKTQTWRLSGEKVPQPFRLFLGPNPLPGYHLILFPLVLLVSHMHFFTGVTWSLEKEFTTLAIFLLWAPLWDYLLFVFNPHYNKKNIRQAWWYARSIFNFGAVPLENVLQWGLSFTLIAVGSLVFQNMSLLINHSYFAVVLTSFTLISIYLLSPL